jgi:hypothetical protein
MSKSPLSGAFAESSATTKKKNKKNGAILLIAGIALTSSIGGVFAANSITLNSDNELEFGQGAATASSCDTAMDTSITQALDETSTAFVVRTVEITDIDGLTGENCDDVALVFGLYEADNAIAITEHTHRVDNQDSFSWDVEDADIDAGRVNRVAITTQD